jgi:3-oxoacyl-[acyl-carrier-protein] synthase-1
MQSTPVYLNHLGIVCALGDHPDRVRQGLWDRSPGGLSDSTTVLPGRTLKLGIVTSELVDLTDMPLSLRSRNNALFASALSQIRQPVDAAIQRFGRERVAIVLGTSTSGIAEGQDAIAHWRVNGALPDNFHIGQQEMGSASALLSKMLGVTGPAFVVSTACSSSAKAMASAARLLRAGLCDAVVTGGMDSICSFTVAGFASLEAVDTERCNPMSKNRLGINIGEGGALFLMTREQGPVELSGWGESSDAHHISAPAPDGRGALEAMRAALERAGLDPSDIDYVNLHGTATPQNDAMESLAVANLFGDQTLVSSTKPLTGHALGGAGALEAALCWLMLYDNPRGLLPVHWWDRAVDPELPRLNLVAPGAALGRPARHILSNSFAFGGSNASLVLSRAPVASAP